MRGISIKAILIAAVSAFPVAMLAIVLGMLMAVVITLISSNDVTTLPEKFNELTRPWIFNRGLAIFAAISAALGAGYIAGRIAKNRFLSHGLLAAIAWMLGGTVYDFFFPGSPDSDWELPTVLNFIVTLGSPILGILGGYLAEMRESQIGAMPIEQRNALSFWSSAYTAFGWMLAFPIAALAYVAALEVTLANVGATTGLVFAVVFSVLAGTAVVRSSQRTIAAYVFISLAILLPAEQLVRHALHGDMRFHHGFYFLLNLFGAGFAYQTLQLGFPEQFGPFPGNWWWLSYHGYARWTPEEKHARRGLSFAAGVTAIFLYCVFEGILRVFVADTGSIIPFEGLSVVILGLWLARPIYSKFYPRKIIQADSNALSRRNTEARGGLSLRRLTTIVASMMVVVVAITLVAG
jgi:hypothetical protein